MSSTTTMLADLINPEVLTDMISAKVEKKIRVIPYAKVDSSLQGSEGDTVTVPRYVWDAEAQDVAEGAAIPIRTLGSSTAKYTVKKAGIGVELTDEAVLSSHGNAVGAAGQNIANSIAAKCDDDAMNQLLQASTSKVTAAAIGYDAIVETIDLFDEEENSEKVMFVNPAQVGTIRKDDDFIDKTKYGNDVMVSGEIGMIANTRVKVSKRVEGAGGYFYNPIVKLTNDAESEDDLPALTYYIKRETNVETDRIVNQRKTEITADQMYTVALTNDSKVVLLKTTGANLKVKNMFDLEYTYPGTSVVLPTTGVTGRVTDLNTSAKTAKVVISGTANALSATDRATLGFGGSITDTAVLLIEVPGAPLNTGVGTSVYFTANGPAGTPTALTADDVVMINGVLYLIDVHGMYDNSGTITSSYASCKLGYGSADNAYTLTWDMTGMKMSS